jgi:hypothetical protein
MGQRHGQVKLIDRRPEVNAVDNSSIRSIVTVHARISMLAIGRVAMAGSNDLRKDTR